MTGWSLESFVLAGFLLAWYLIPTVTGLVKLHLVHPLIAWRQREQAKALLTDEELRLREQLRAEKAGDRVEIGYGTEEEVIESMRRRR